MKNIFKKIKDLIKTRRFLACFLLFFILSNIFQISTKAAGELDLNTTVSQDFLSGSLETLSKIGGAVVMFPIATVAFFISNFASSLIELEAKLLSWVVDISQFTKLEVVQMGWKICRDFANLFFIAILIYIAFATILRLQKGDTKKLLFKVIVMAVVINFSLMIGGIIIDFSQILFKYFIFSNLSLKTGVGFTNGLAHALNLQSLWATDDILINASSVSTKVLSMGFFNVAIKLLFILLFSFIIIVVFGALVLMLLVRNFWLWILLILSPLAWFLGIVPVPILSKYSGEWWKNFIKWTFMAPIMGFFVFLALSTVFFNKGENGNAYTANQLYPKELLARQWEGDNSVFNFENNKSIFDPTNVMQLLVVLGFLVGGLMAGQSLGSGAAKGALSMINKAGKNTQKWMGRKAMQTKPVQAVGNKLMQWGNAPIIGGVFKRAGMATQGGVAKAKEEEMATVKKRMSYMTPEEMNKHAKTFNANEMIYAGKEEKFRENISLENWEKLQKIYSNKGMNNDVKKLEKEHPLFKADVRVDMTEFKTLTDILKASLSDLKSKQATLDGLPAGSPPATIAAATAARDAAKLQVNTDQTNHDAKRVIIENHLRNLDPEKISGAVKSTIFGDTNSIEFNALASVAATKPPQEGIEKIMKEMSKTKDGVTNMSTMVFKMAENVEGKTVTEKINKMRNLRILQRLNNNFLAAKLGFREPEINTHLASLYPV